jgi:hypothetical protein
MLADFAAPAPPRGPPIFDKSWRPSEIELAD